MSFAPTTIDLSALPAPDVIETISFETLNSDFLARFTAIWASLRAANPSLPDYDVQVIEGDPVVVLGEALSEVRTLDRARVNDAARAVLAPLATGSNLDVIAARIGVQRVVITPSPDGGVTPPVTESDEQLLRRYLLAFDRPSAGSADRYLYEVYTAFPLAQDAAINGFGVHGRRGDVDIVVAGPGGRLPTQAEIAAINARVLDTSVKPEATSVSVLAAKRALYTVQLGVSVPRGPDPALVQTAAAARVTSAANDRLKIGAEVPMDLIAGYAYGPNVIVVDRSKLPADIAPDPYAIPVMAGLTITTKVLG